MFPSTAVYLQSEKTLVLLAIALEKLSILVLKHCLETVVHL